MNSETRTELAVCGLDCTRCADYENCGKQFEGETRERWLERNNRINEVGVGNYYLEQSKLPRY
ncbi:hypothetical protein [Desulfosporosinus youngiae]|uniref:DUF3795 domain-containing protein n=1 Tax=Desulfosporosinus youngiae DSM 17734 TaxID=768710 RepID=H5XUP1_9FIRM|nr:hypothetical protein [Desulfosporosinus youngiae]EHQ89198.1 hypothetical protein DesyoDRAFT_2106 [Desulfosporosinus youngiae DSM 17734]